MADLRNTVCRSHEPANNDNTRHGAFNASQLIFESAKFDSLPATVTARAACPAGPIVGAPTNNSTSIPGRTYSAAVIAAPAKDQRQPKQARGAQRPSEQVRSSLPAVTRTGQTDQEGFVRVVNKKKKKPACRNQCGSAPTGPNMLLRPAIPSTQLYVSRLHHSTKVEEVVEYIKMKTKFSLRVEQLESRHKINFKSFVVRVPTHHLETFLKEEFWPTGVVYRRFRGRLHDTTTQRNTSPTQRIK